MHTYIQTTSDQLTKSSASRRAKIGAEVQREKRQMQRKNES